jgi:small-conductance mechanosensitive channel
MTELVINNEAFRAAATIKTYSADIDETAKHIKTQEEMADEIRTKMTAYHEVERLEDELKTAREKLKVDLIRNSNYNDLLEEIGQSKETLKSQKSILSDHIVAYYALTQERQVQTEANGDARQLIVTGKLGKVEKYQTSLFSKGE